MYARAGIPKSPASCTSSWKSRTGPSASSRRSAGVFSDVVGIWLVERYVRGAYSCLETGSVKRHGEHRRGVDDRLVGRRLRRGRARGRRRRRPRPDGDRSRAPDRRPGARDRDGADGRAPEHGVAVRHRDDEPRAREHHPRREAGPWRGGRARRARASGPGRESRPAVGDAVSWWVVVLAWLGLVNGLAAALTALVAL